MRFLNEARNGLKTVASRVITPKQYPPTPRLRRGSPIIHKRSKWPSILAAANKALIFLFKAFRPLLGPASCKFSISCGDYAVLQLQELALHKACCQIFKRLIRCNPLLKKKPL